MKDLIFFFLNRYVLLNSFKVIKELIVTTLSLFFSFISSCFSSDRITELIWRLFLLKPDHHLLEWRNRGLFETNAFGNTYTVLRLSHIFSLSYKRLFQALSENGENLIMRWKLFGISMLTMKILFMELLNTQIMSKINSLLDKIIDQGKRSNIIRSFFIYNGLFLLCIYWKRGKKLWDVIVSVIFQPVFRPHMGFLLLVYILVVFKRRDLSDSAEDVVKRLVLLSNH